MRERPDLRAIFWMLFLIGTFGLNFTIFISTMAVSVFHAGAGRYGLLMSIMAIGTISGVAAGGARQQPRIEILLTSAALFGVGCALAALMPDYWLFGAALMLIGVSALTFANSTNSLLQLGTEPAMRGRVMAMRLAIALGGTPIGAPIVGWVADTAGPALGAGRRRRLGLRRGGRAGALPGAVSPPAGARGRRPAADPGRSGLSAWRAALHEAARASNSAASGFIFARCPADETGDARENGGRGNLSGTSARFAPFIRRFPGSASLAILRAKRATPPPRSPMSALTEDQARTYMHKLLAAMAAAGGSDLFIANDFPPSMKVDGGMKPMTAQKLTADVTRALAHAMMTERQREEFAKRAGVQLRGDDPRHRAASASTSWCSSRA